jgi:2-polyprenyl-3-methyl-5-hydroxy-6-metoxy-1,4-benzoquinol methylase
VGDDSPGRCDDGAMPAHRDVYTHGHQDAVLRSHRSRTVANSAAYLAPYLRPGLDLLDVGCGPGTLTVDLARHVAPGRVLGVDTSSEVVEAARAFAAGEGLAASEVTFQAGDFRQLADPTAVQAFDVVHAHQVLQHLRDPVGALRAMAALTRPGGVVAARDADYPAMVWAPDEPGLDRWREVYLAVTRRNGAAADAGRHLLAWAQAAGLDDAAYTTSTWTYATPEERGWWADLWAERTVASSFAAQAVDYGVAAAEELDEVADAWRAWATRPDAVFVVVHGEVAAGV